MAVCKLCSLHETRHHTFDGCGVLPCDFLFIASHPSSTEDLLRKPFIGKSRIIFDIMECTGIKSAYLTYMVRCRPCDSFDDPTREPTKMEILKCQEHILALVPKAMPSVIVFIGKLVDTHYRQYFKNAITILDLDYLTRSGGKSSPYWSETINKLERAKHAVFHN